MMGPTLIFDKSAFQALNPDEALWLDNFYICNITPLFFVETLADLEKEVKSGKKPEEIVGSLAYKTPESGCINAPYKSLLQGELSIGQEVKMEGRPVISGAQVMKLGNETGVIYRTPPEAEAFERWQKHEFWDVERRFARQWREDLIDVLSSDDVKIFQKFFSSLGTPKNFEELWSMINSIIDHPEQKMILNFGLSLIGVSPEARVGIFERWDKSQSKTLRSFAPYFTHVFLIDLFFHLGTAAALFSSFRHPQTHKIDIAYLYYLPFCNIFVSSDKLHIGIASFFKRPDQTFISGQDFKTDLAKLDQHYTALPEDVKNRGVVTFAATPPDDVSFLTTQMWDKYMANTWRNIQGMMRKFDGTDHVDEKVEEELHSKITRFSKEAVPVGDDELRDSDRADHMVIEHRIAGTKGKWKRFPPEILNSKKRILD